MRVNKFIDKLRRYGDLSIRYEVIKDILNELEGDRESEDDKIFKTDNLHTWIPKWKELKAIEISFEYRPTDQKLFIHVRVTKDGLIWSDNKKLTINGQFAKRMCTLIVNEKVYNKQMVKDCFSYDLLEEFRKLKIKLIIGPCNTIQDEEVRPDSISYDKLANIKINALYVLIFIYLVYRSI